MSDFVKVASTSEISKGKMKGFEVKGNKLLIANVNGKYYSVCSICPHRKGPLQEGELNGNNVTCPWHGSEFDITSGKVTKGPATENIKKYEVKVDGKDILIKI